MNVRGQSTRDEPLRSSPVKPLSGRARAISADHYGSAESLGSGGSWKRLVCLQTSKFTRPRAELKRVRIPRPRTIFDDERGAVAVMFAVVLPILLGVAGLAVEASYWQLHQRAMQNAADSAAIAASMEGGTNYVAVAQAVAAQYGFVNGSGNIAVTVSNPASAAGCTSNCYSVSISDNVPLLLSAVLGYQGTTSVNSNPI